MIHDLRPYPAMKDSSVPWLGKVPEHWDVVPNRAVFQEVNERGYGDEQMLSVTITQGVIKQRELLEASSKKDSSRQDKSAYKLVRPGDIAYNKMRAWQGALGASPLRGIVSPAYVVVRPRDENNPAYFHYLMRTPTFAKEAERWSYGITSDMWSLRPEHFRLIYTCVPSPDEQAAIVRFLDHADRRIRRVIAAKQKLIRLLQEQKQVIIHQAVTRGLDPNVKLKPSGVEWLGEVPEGWEVVKLGQIIRDGPKNGISPTASESEVHTKSSSISVIRDGYFDLLEDDIKYVAQVDEKSTIKYSICQGDILLVRGNGNITKVGRAGLVKENIEGFIYPDILMRVRLKENANSKFISLVINSITTRQQIENAAKTAVGSYKINNQQVRQLVVALPSKLEQESIVFSIDKSIESLQLLIKKAVTEISLLREYRTRLIADVVTGKLDVREAALFLPEPTEEAVPGELEAGAEGEEQDADEVEAEGVEA